MDRSVDAVVLILGGKILYANNTTRTLAGRAVAAGDDWMPFIHESSRADLDQCLKNPVPHACRFKFVTGAGPRICEATVTPVATGGGTGILLVFRDVHARAEAEESLVAERNLALSIFEKLPVIADVIDPSTHEILYVNKYARDLLGTDPVGRRCYEVFHRYKDPCPYCTNAQVMSAPERPHHWEYHSEVLDRDFFVTNVALKWIDGRDVKFEFSIDITDRLSVERELRRLAAAVNSAAETIVITDPRGIIQYVNPAFEAMTGYTRSEVVGEHIRIVKSGRHDNAFYARLWSTLKSGQTWQGRFVNKRKDGSLFEEDGSIAPVLDARGNISHYVAVKRDVTREAELERQVRQSQKMAALGQLAHRLTHNFTNTLLAILGNAEMARRLNNDPRIADNLNQITDLVGRVSQLTAQLMAFAHSGQGSMRVVSLDKIVAGIEEILRRSADPSMQLAIHAEDKLRVKADASQIEQALVHLAINAFEAMPRGGQLTINLTRGKFMDMEPSDRHTGTDRPAPREREAAVITVTDTGVGIEDSILPRIFEPFYTTKQDRRNAGLGLSIVYNILARHDGHISVTSQPGKGATFTLFIPLIEDSSATSHLPV
jgi:two-component system cell cycle sensor histidine kinase/response regulator CckA